MSYKDDDKHSNKAMRLVVLSLISAALVLAGCNTNISNNFPQQESGVLADNPAGLDKENPNASEAVSSTVESLAVEDLFSDRDLDSSYDSDEATQVTLNQSYTITEAGTYIFSGQLNQGQIIVDAKGEKVQIVLNDVEITNEDSACIYVKKADKVFLTLAEGTTNKLTTTGAFQPDGDINVDGVIFAKADLTVNGTGSLQIISAEGNGIVCKDELVVADGNFLIEAAGHAIEGKDRVCIADGNFDLQAGKDGVHSENEDTDLGYIYVKSGVFNIQAGSQGMDASSILQLDGGQIQVQKCREGLEASKILLCGADVSVVAEDDGINASGGTSGNTPDGTPGGTPGGRANSIIIAGGNLVINAYGDGLDANGNIEIKGGSIVISGPVDNGNTAVDFDGNCTITGGVLIATGSSGMVERISDASTQVSMTIGLSDYTTEGFTITDARGKVLISAQPEKRYNCIIFSSPELQVGEKYTVTAGSESKEVEITENVYSEVAGFGPGGHGGRGGQDGFGPDGRDGKGGFNPGEHGEFTRPDDFTRPDKKPRQ